MTTPLGCQLVAELPHKMLLVQHRRQRWKSQQRHLQRYAQQRHLQRHLQRDAQQRHLQRSKWLPLGFPQIHAEHDDLEIPLVAEQMTMTMKLEFSFSSLFLFLHIPQIHAEHDDLEIFW